MYKSIKFTGLTLILLFILAGPAFSQVCGDANCNGQYEITDLTAVTDYLYLSYTPVSCPDNVDVDGLPGITNGDLIFLVNSKYVTSEILSCPSPPDSVPPVYDVILSFFDNVVPAGSSTWSIDVWEKNLDSIETVAIPFSYSCPGVNLKLNSIDVNFSRYAGLTGLIDDVAEEALIAVKSWLPQVGSGMGLLATLNFTLDPQTEDTVIHIDTTTYIPSHHLVYTNIQSNVTHSFVPHLYVGPCCIGYTGNVDCSYYEDPDISDITRLIDYLYISNDPLCCPEEANVNASPELEPDISDITKLIDYLYLSHAPLPVCP